MKQMVMAVDCKWLTFTILTGSRALRFHPCVIGKRGLATRASGIPRAVARPSALPLQPRRVHSQIHSHTQSERAGLGRAGKQERASKSGQDGPERKARPHWRVR